MNNHRHGPRGIGTDQRGPCPCPCRSRHVAKMALVARHGPSPIGTDPRRPCRRLCRLRRCPACSVLVGTASSVLARTGGVRATLRATLGFVRNSPFLANGSVPFSLFRAQVRANLCLASRVCCKARNNSRLGFRTWNCHCSLNKGVDEVRELFLNLFSSTSRDHSIGKLNSPCKLLPIMIRS